MTMPYYRFRVVVNGVVQAGCEGSDRDRALEQITHYAHLYAGDAPAQVQEKIGKRWFNQFEVKMGGAE